MPRFQRGRELFVRQATVTHTSQAFLNTLSPSALTFRSHTATSLAQLPQPPTAYLLLVVGIQSYHVFSLWSPISCFLSQEHCVWDNLNAVKQQW